MYLQSEITCHVLRPGQGGMFSGWRRMSTLLFSSAAPVVRDVSYILLMTLLFLLHIFIDHNIHYWIILLSLFCFKNFILFYNSSCGLMTCMQQTLVQFLHVTCMHALVVLGRAPGHIALML